MKSAVPLSASTVYIQKPEKEKASAETAAAARDRPGRCVEVGTETADFNASLLLRPKLHDDVLGSPSFVGYCWNCDGGPGVSVA